MNTSLLETLPKHYIKTGYFTYVATFYLNAANAIQREIGVKDLPNGLTPDIVKLNPEYRENIRKMKAAHESAKKYIPAAKELRKIIGEYHKIYDMGQRIKINGQFGSAINDLLARTQGEILPYSEYEIAIQKAFENFQV